MAEEVIYTVFVSSTFEDLQRERAEVLKSLLKLKCMPIGMELFGSADEQTWEYIKRQIDNSDYYVLIIADRYGSLAPDDVSYTEKEYNYAREIGKPTLSFIHGNRDKIIRSYTESDPQKREKLENFIEKVKKSPVSFFHTPDELAKEVITSFVNYRDQYSAVGYVRADKVIDTKKYADLLEENIKLNSQIRESKEEKLFDGYLDVIKGSYKVVQKNSINEYITTIREFEVDLIILFMMIADNIILNSYSEYSICRRIIIRLASEEIIGKVSSAEFVREFGYDVFGDIKKRLFGLGLVEFYDFADEGSNVKCWKLTSYGQRQYGLQMRA